ncbi:MAG TPA: aminoglycoside phosphotransferase family protein [Gemmatimonadales bacterium]|nr:aminoglycoside phosphotransferase family protein [Gemmatimonadales bacterium]
MRSSSIGTPRVVSAPDLPEALLNPLLRRVDWRFLLHAPRVRRAVCFADGELRRGLELVAEELVAAESGAADCDLAAVAGPDLPTLLAASAALRPGGVCYIEWPRPGPGGRRRLAAMLRTAGFEQPRSYLAWRSARRASVWLPLESPSAARYFERELHARTRRPVARVLRTLVTLGGRAGIAGTLSTVARKPGPGDELPEPAFFGIIRRDWARWGFPGTPEALSLMLLTGGPRSLSKVAGFVFTDADSGPPLVVKMARAPGAAPGLMREARILRALEASCAGGPLRMPRVIFSVDDHALVAVGETALRGVPLLSLLNRRNYRALALQATDWLIRLALCSRQSGAPAAGRVVAEEWAQFERTFGHVLSARQLADARRVLSQLDGVHSVCEHRDFSPWNVFLAPDRQLAVLDWESAEMAGAPALDLLYFLVYLGAGLGGKITSDGVLGASREAHDPATFTGAVYRECLGRYADGIGLDPGCLPALRLLLWLLHARSERARLAADAGGAPSDKALRGSLFLRLWEAELLRQQSG